MNSELAYIGNSSAQKVSDSIILILLKILNVAAQTFNLWWVVYLSIVLESEVEIGLGIVGCYLLIHGLISIWSFLYIVDPAKFQLEWFRIVSKLLSGSIIALTLYCVFLMLSGSEYGLNGFLFVFYIGFTQTLVSITLLLCFLFEKTQEQQRKIVVYKMAGNDAEDTLRTQTILMI